MAGKIIQRIFVDMMEYGDLTLYLASSGKGAIKVGIRMAGDEDPVSFFSPFFPKATLIRSAKHNTFLATAIRAALGGKPLPNSFCLDVQLTPFQHAAYQCISRIPYGQTMTYGEVASAMGLPRAARAVGQAMRVNPLPIIFP